MGLVLSHHLPPHNFASGSFYHVFSGHVDSHLERESSTLLIDARSGHVQYISSIQLTKSGLMYFLGSKVMRKVSDSPAIASIVSYHLYTSMV